MGLLIYLNGEFVSKEKAVVSVFDHGLLYGDGVFEGIRSYNCNVFKLREHLERLYDSAKYIMLDIPLSLDELEQAVVETLKRNHLKDAYIRLVITRGVGDLGLAPWKCPKPTIFIIADSIALYPADYYKKGLEIVTAPTRRLCSSAFSTRAKTLNYLNNIMAKIEGKNGGALEALMLSEQGYVLECTGDNIFLIKNNELITPPEHIGILKGITRDSVMDLARKQGYNVKEQLFTLFDVYTADECFLTGTAAEVIPVVKVDGRIISDGTPGPVTAALIREFQKITSELGTKYEL